MGDKKEFFPEGTHGPYFSVTLTWDQKPTEKSLFEPDNKYNEISIIFFPDNNTLIRYGGLFGRTRLSPKKNTSTFQEKAFEKAFNHPKQKPKPKT